MDIDDESEACYRASCPLCKKMELVWKCSFCGYLHLEVDAPPDTCPDCGHPKEQFELVEED